MTSVVRSWMKALKLDQEKDWEEMSPKERQYFLAAEVEERLQEEMPPGVPGRCEAVVGVQVNVFADESDHLMKVAAKCSCGVQTKAPFLLTLGFVADCTGEELLPRLEELVSYSVGWLKAIWGQHLSYTAELTDEQYEIYLELCKGTDMTWQQYAYAAELLA